MSASEGAVREGDVIEFTLRGERRTAEAMLLTDDDVILLDLFDGDRPAWAHLSALVDVVVFRPDTRRIGRRSLTSPAHPPPGRHPPAANGQWPRKASSSHHDGRSLTTLASTSSGRLASAVDPRSDGVEIGEVPHGDGFEAEAPGDGGDVGVGELDRRRGRGRPGRSGAPRRRRHRRCRPRRPSAGPAGRPCPAR